MTRASTRRGAWAGGLACVSLLAILSFVAALALASAHSKPTLLVVNASAGGSDTFKVIVPVRKGRACAGKVTLSAGAARAHGKLSSHAGVCMALLHLKLRSADFGKSVAFSLQVAGAGGVSRFASTLHLHLVAPTPAGGSPTTPTATTPTLPTTTTPTTPTTPAPPPPAGYDGTYRAILDEGNTGKGSPWSEFEMIIKGGVITNIGLYTAAAVTVECFEGIKPVGKITLDYNPIGPLSTDSVGNGLFSASYMTKRYKVEFNGTLKFDPATKQPYGETSFKMAGTVIEEGKTYSCSREAHAANFYYYAP